ncbi:MAG TPA: cobalamin-binding protein [Nitrospiraceae bacterium]|nr:cobalamin-binding protein [Nitrospiraceae bacterium]
MRICSLVPGATEVITALGLADDLVGISHECDYPPAIKHKPVMVRATIDSDCSSSTEIDHQVNAAIQGGQQLYELDEGLFTRAQPDLVITQDLCHVCAVTPSQLQQAIGALPHKPQLLSLNPTNLDDVLMDVERIGAAAKRLAEARTLSAALRARLESIRGQVASENECPTVACLEWLSPLYAAGHWVPQMVAWAGGLDRLGSAGAPSRQVTWDHLLAAAPDVLVLMPCGFSINRTLRELNHLTVHPGWQDLPAVRNGRVFAVDASSYFSRPGPRLVDGVAILASLFHPSRFGGTIPDGARHLNLLDAHSQ